MLRQIINDIALPMMKIFDSHCHLDDPCYDRDLEMVLKRAHQAQVEAMLAVGVDGPSSQRAVAIAGRYGHIFASVGIHPHDAQNCTASMLNTLRALAADPKVKAWGEIGLDFNRMYSPRREQEFWFGKQLELAAELDLPVIFHKRDSQGRFLEILKDHWGPQRNGVVHCFSGNSQELDAYLDLGLHIGITGILTIKTRGENLRRLAKRIPVQRLLVETDAPYLTPTPERNKFRRNEPAFVRSVLFKLAEVLNQRPEIIAQNTWNNACRLLRLDSHRPRPTA